MEPFPMARVFSSKENKQSLETGETSFRVYYGATGATIPFMWESQPGTPKHPIFSKNDNIVPPLTPPPSYSLRGSSCNKKSTKYNKIFRAFISSFSRSSRSRSSHVTPTSSLSLSLSSCNSYSSPLSWSTSSTSSSSPRSSPRGKCNKSHRRSFSFGNPREKSPFFGEEEEERNVGGLGSIMCFGFKKQQANKGVTLCNKFMV
ncbi:uncharacterized protein LOC110699470 [Chenopodium quinoa]|uniref:uncharacterized protein LOC110699470 n=1 Tax=Chenopodium quinoa TaxID=63459 RepID=UPI000B7844F1|nr:uncharacterized protein LOC110699470 [Chenopodium quinoa]